MQSDSIPPRILAISHNNITEGSTFARLGSPLAALKLAGKVEYQIVTPAVRRADLIRQQLHDLPNWDLIWLQRPHHYVILPFIRQARRLGKPVLIDIDDWLLDVPVDSTDAWLFGTRTCRETIHTAFRAATAITVSTPSIAERCTALGLNAHVLPNAVDCAKFMRTSHNADVITIAFCGTPSHRADVPLLTPALRMLLDRFPDRLRVVSVGCLIPELQGMIGYTHYDWIAATEYPKFISSLGIDIGLAPLQDTPFNRAKSDIKYLEYSAIGAVTIASSVAPYQDSVAADRGILVRTNSAEAWYDAILQLVANAALRHRLASSAFEWVRTERAIDVMADKWLELFRCYIEEHMLARSLNANYFEAKRFEHMMASIVLRQLPTDIQQVGYVLVHHANASARARLAKYLKRSPS